MQTAKDISKIFVALLFSMYCICPSVFSQTFEDAVRYSNLNYSGTARTAGVAGSFGSMGGDFGVLSINPAGLADFRKSEVGFSLSINTSASDAFFRADANNISSENLGIKLNLDNIGMVFSSQPRGSRATSNFAIGFSQISNYGENIFFEGNTAGTYSQRFVEVANGISEAFGERVDGEDPYESDLAFNIGAIKLDPNSDLYYVSDVEDYTTVLQKSQRIERSGQINELSFTYGTNWNNKFGIGIGLGIPFSSFEETKTYRENDSQMVVDTFEQLKFDQILSTSGIGANLKIGANARIAKILRVGLAFHSPTYFRFNETFDTDLEFTADTHGNFELCDEPVLEDGNIQTCYIQPEFIGEFDYTIITPYKLVLSLGTLLNLNEKLKGFVNADVEYKDYSSNKFKFSERGDISFENELNDEIDEFLQSAINIKIGGELAYQKFRIRAGANLIGSPYKDETYDNVSNLYSLGFGFRADKFYIDAAVQSNSTSNGFTVYRLVDAETNPWVNNTTNRLKFLLTVGFKFR